MRLFYAIDYAPETRSTETGIQAFGSMADRDEFVDGGWRESLTARQADTSCFKTHDCTATEAFNRGFI